MADQFTDMLFDRVDRADNFNALARIMPHIGIELSEVKAMMKRKIRTLKAVAAKQAVFHVMPMDTLLPMDSLQHIMFVSNS